MADDEPCLVCRDGAPRSKGAAKKAKDMNCKELADKIEELVDRERPGRAGTKGLKQRFRDYQGDDLTHGEHYDGQQSSLNSYLDEFFSKGCGDPPDGAMEWATKKLPQPTPAPSSSSSNTVLAVAGVIGTGALIVLGIFFLPEEAVVAAGVGAYSLASP